MNPQHLLQHFDRISEAPDTIPQLRRFILDLAVRGKLVDQDPNDEPASELLKRIQVEKGRLVKEERIKSDKKVWEGSSINPPYNLPNNWCWVRLQDIFEVSRGGSPRPAGDPRFFGGEIPWITVGEITKDLCKYLTFTSTGLTDEGANRSRYINPGDLLLTNSGATLGVPKISKIRGCMNDGVAVLRLFHSFDLNDYAYVYLTSQTSAFRNLNQGMGQPNLNTPIIAGWHLSLPPLAEQHRIVAKVDELMALCDQLEAAHTQRDSRRDRLVAATLHELPGLLHTSTREACSVRTVEGQPPPGVLSISAHPEQTQCVEGPLPQSLNAHFFLNHLPLLTTRPAHIKQLRQTILNLAVRGKLVAQDPTDEPASELLKRIQVERAELIKQGRIRKEKPLVPLQKETQPFVIPKSWQWEKIGISTLFTEYGTSEQSDHSESGVPVLKMGDIQNGALVLGGQKKVPKTIDDLPALYLEKFDLLYNRTNSAELVGKTGIYLGEDDEYTFASYLIRIRCSKQSSNPVYFNLAMSAPFFRETQIVPHLKQQCGQANVNGTILKNMIIPLPPLAEQRRIVARVDELMALCDQLEAQLTTTATDSRRLLEAVLYEALSE